MKKRVGSLILSLSLCLSLAAPALAVETVHDIGKGGLRLDSSSCPEGCRGHRVTGATTEHSIQILGGRHTLILDGVDIEKRDFCPMEIRDGAVADLELRGSSRLSMPGGTALFVKEATATIKGNGSLTATTEAKAVVKSESQESNQSSVSNGKATVKITLNGGGSQINPTMNIGGYQINPTMATRTEYSGNEVGGIYVNKGSLTIAGGDIEANGGEKGAGILGIDMDLTVTGGSVHAQGDRGAGIGLGSSVNTVRIGRIHISGGHVTAESQYNAGIGADGGFRKADMDLIIDGGTVEARGTYGLGGALERFTMPMAPAPDNHIYIDNATVTAEGTTRGIEAKHIQLTNNAHVEVLNNPSHATAPVGTLEMGIYDSYLKVYSENKDVTTGIELLISTYEKYEDSESELHANGKRTLEVVWGDDPDLSASFTAVDSTLDIDGGITRGETQYDTTIQFWDSTVNVGAIGLNTLCVDPVFPRIDIHGGELTSKGGIIGEITVYDGTVDVVGGQMGMGPHVTIFDGEITSRSIASDGVGIGGMKKVIHVKEDDKYAHKEIHWPARVIICDGDVTAVGNSLTDPAWGGGGAGIGGSGSEPCDGGYIAIYGGNVLAKGGVGADQSEEHIKYMSDFSQLNALGEAATNAPGIGGNGDGGNGGELYIAGGKVTAVGGAFAAGIGGGSLSSGGQIVISGGTVEAYGGISAAAIGGGWASYYESKGRAGEIYITGGDVTAIGAEKRGAGIGNGRSAKPSEEVPSLMVITGGNVTATGGLYSAGIGGTGMGNFGLADRSGGSAGDPATWGGSDGGEVIIGGDAYVKATGGPGVWGIGGGIPDNSSSGWNPGRASRLTIRDDAQVKATVQGSTSSSGTIPPIPEIPEAPEPEEGKKPEPMELPEETGSLPFEDMSRYAWYADAVEYALENQLFTGIDDTHFDPDGSMTRAMLVTVLHRAEGKPAPRGTVSFDDVPAGKWYTDAVLWAAEQGIVNGVGGGLFAPEREITRQELAVVLYNQAGAPEEQAGSLSDYSDSNKIADWAKSAVRWMKGNKLWVYQERNELKGSQNATRAEVAAVLYAVLTKEK